MGRRAEIQRMDTMDMEEEVVNSEPVHFDTGAAGSSQEPFTSPAPKLDRLIEGVRSLEQWYAVDFERRIAGLTELLKNQIAEELRGQFSVELNTHVERIRRQYEERIYTQAGQWEAQREVLEREIADLRRRVPSGDVMNEIAATEAVIGASMGKGNHEFERLIPDAASLGKLLQSRIEELETKAYLRGLKFRTADIK
jgi:hypothetical protein